MNSTPGTDLNSPDSRARNIQNLDFLPSSVLPAAKKNLAFFLINMQMQGNQIYVLNELIPATPSACVVIRNYRQASDARLKP